MELLKGQRNLVELCSAMKALSVLTAIPPEAVITSSGVIPHRVYCQSAKDSFPTAVPINSSIAKKTGLTTRSTTCLLAARPADRGAAPARRTCVCLHSPRFLIVAMVLPVGQNPFSPPPGASAQSPFAGVPRLSFTKGRCRLGPCQGAAAAPPKVRRTGVIKTLPARPRPGSLVECEAQRRFQPAASAGARPRLVSGRRGLEPKAP